MPKTEEERIQQIKKVIDSWPEDCPNRPTLAQALLQPEILHSQLEDPGIATLTSGSTVELYHLEKAREVIGAKLAESEIPGRHTDIFQYLGDKSPELELVGFVDSESEYTAIKTTLTTMRQAQGASPINVTVRCGASAYINGVQYWVGPVEIDPEPGYGIFVANYRIHCRKRG